MPRIAKRVAMTRLNLELSVATREMLERLRDQTQADSMAEVIRRALMIYEYLIKHGAGNSVTVLDKENRQIEILF